MMTTIFECFHQNYYFGDLNVFMVMNAEDRVRMFPQNFQFVLLFISDGPVSLSLQRNKSHNYDHDDDHADCDDD